MKQSRYIWTTGEIFLGLRSHFWILCYSRKLNNTPNPQINQATVQVDLTELTPR